MRCAVGPVPCLGLRVCGGGSYGEIVWSWYIVVFEPFK